MDAENIQHLLKAVEELKAANVPVLHFYTMGKAEPTAEIARAVF